ncbi:non-canonical purine NTP pyrophosphatase, partial [Wenzhouxiangella sp. EGI_FJ10409]
KARSAADGSGLPALADDSGLSVAALGGAPGLYSARWAVRPDGTRDFAFAMERVRQELVAAESERGLDRGRDRRASFLCALALAWPDGDAEAVVGTVDGTLVFPPRGLAGFGYDPIFLPDGHSLTFGEMEPDAKHAISHRADAFAKMRELCFGGR